MCFMHMSALTRGSTALVQPCMQEPREAQGFHARAYPKNGALSCREVCGSYSADREVLWWIYGILALDDDHLPGFRLACSHAHDACPKELKERNWSEWFVCTCRYATFLSLWSVTTVVFLKRTHASIKRRFKLPRGNRQSENVQCMCY